MERRQRAGLWDQVECAHTATPSTSWCPKTIGERSGNKSGHCLIEMPLLQKGQVGVQTELSISLFPLGIHCCSIQPKDESTETQILTMNNSGHPYLRDLLEES